jgi:hypothetical protein
MITQTDLSNRRVTPEELSPRQREAFTLIEAYYRVAREAPSYGWLGRQLGVSRQTAAEYIDVLRRKGWLDRP